MNSEPHIHPIQVREEYNTFFPGDGLRIRYGDTEVKVWRWFKIQPSLWRLRLAVKRAVRKHDRGSIRADKRQNRYAQVQTMVSEPGTWGREQLSARNS